MVKTETETGKTEVTVGGEAQKIEFSFNTIKDSNGDAPSFAEVCEHLLGTGFQTELPGPAQLKRLKEENPNARRIAEPRSLTRALIYFYSQKNRQEAMADAIDTATNTAESKVDKAISFTVGMIVDAKFDDVVTACMNALVNGYAVKSRLAVVVALKKLAENHSASEFARNLAAENVALLED